MVRDGRIYKMKKTLESACKIAGWECQDDSSRMMYIRQILKYYDKLQGVEKAECRKKKSYLAGVRIYREMNIKNGMDLRNWIRQNEHLGSRLEGRDSLEKFYLLVKQYFKEVKLGKQPDLNGKKEGGDYIELRGLINSFLPSTEKINEERLDIFE